MAYHSRVGERTGDRNEAPRPPARLGSPRQRRDGPRDGNGSAAPDIVVAAGPKKRLANHDATLPRP